MRSRPGYLRTIVALSVLLTAALVAAWPGVTLHLPGQTPVHRNMVQAYDVLPITTPTPKPSDSLSSFDQSGRDKERIAQVMVKAAIKRQQRQEQRRRQRALAARSAAPVATQQPSSPSGQPTPVPAPTPTAPPVPTGSPQSIAQSLLSSFGQDLAQWPCLDELWTRESGWNPAASNPGSGAYGIPQALPGSKMASAGPDWMTNPATQIKWGLGYIQANYGTACAAWAHELAFGWY